MPTVNGRVRDMALLISPSVLKYLYNFRVVNIRGVFRLLTDIIKLVVLSLEGSSYLNNCIDSIFWVQ